MRRVGTGDILKSRLKQDQEWFSDRISRSADLQALRAQRPGPASALRNDPLEGLTGQKQLPAGGLPFGSPSGQLESLHEAVRQGTP